MKKKLLLINCLLTSLLLAQKKPATHGIPASIHKSMQHIQKTLENVFKYDSIPGDPFHTRIYTLPNGLKVYLSPYHAQPKVFTMIAVKAGSKYDPADATGLAHYLEHMLFKGTDNYGTKNYAAEKPLLDKIEELFELYRQTNDESQRKKIYHQIDSISLVASKYAIANEYDKMTAAIGAQNTNAFTTNDETVYVNEIPSNQIDNWLDIEAERFRNPVFRLFHTELEAVYEEKNRSLDNDEWQMYETLFKELFPNHPYGTQTTIGTIEHLKNPSLKEIKKYYEKYYVPNNMAIIMSGDFNPDSVIRKIFVRFASFPAKPVEPVNFSSPNLTQRIQKTVYGPKSEMIMMGWKTDGAASRDALMLSLISKILYNSKSGLLDINVNSQQKVLSSSADYEPMKDYCALILFANPKQNQSLEEVEKILLEEIHKLQKGEFDEQLLKDIVTNKKLELQITLENHIARAYKLFSAFTKDVPLQNIVNEINQLKKITKNDIVHFAQQYLRDDNYVVVYKKTGTNSNIKVTKPEITPVELDRENTSEFAKRIMENKPQPIAPKFIDFKKDIQIYPLEFKSSTTIKTLELLYNQNKENELFELTYYYHLPDNTLKKYEILFKYLNDFPATQNLSTEQLQKKLYQLGCDIKFYLSKTESKAYLTISGLSENSEQAIKIAEEILSQPRINPATFSEFINDELKERDDIMKDKNKILRQLMGYATYGPQNMYNNVLTNDELKQLNTNELEQLLKDLNGLSHQFLYYGPLKSQNIINLLKQHHQIPDKNIATSSPKVYATELLDKGNLVFYIPYSMQQAEFFIINKVSNFNEKLMPQIELFNNYFGGNMSGVVFQEIREAKALAYSARSYITTPINKNYPFINVSYIGTQSDKLSEALSSMYSLLDSIPYNATSFNAAKEGIIQQIRTERILKTDLFFEYLKAKNLGLNHDIRKDIFEQVQKMDFKDIQQFHSQYIRKKPRNIAIIGDENKLNFDVLKKYGTLQKVNLKEVFGY
ncbi:MAG: peptidase M16 [Bacteroidia bacterium]|nr:MAG: peptidase M16 [Bacteroidia bacterium]